MFVRVIDENGFFVCDDFLDELTENAVETPCPDGFYKPKWDGTQWIEGLTEQEITELKQPIIPTAEERLQALESAMLDLILGG